MRKVYKAGSLIISLILFWGCGGRPVPHAGKALPERIPPRIVVSKPSASLEPVKDHEIPHLPDDLDRQSLLLAIDRSLQYFSRFKDRDIFFLGGYQCTVQEMKDTLSTFREITASTESPRVKERQIRENFSFFRSVGEDGRGRVIFTGYYEPVLNGSWSQTSRYIYPLYRLPLETVIINLGKFSEKFQNEQLVGRVKNGEVVPHYKRAEIDIANSLAGRNLELLWVDDLVDLFFLHIQGSGRIRLPDGAFVRVGYAQSNGHPYRSIGRHLAASGKLAGNEQSLQGIKKFLKEHPEEIRQILSYNERYVFFRLLDEGPIGALNVPVTEGRTIAADPEVYPKGALAFIRAKKPLLERGKVLGWTPFSRFVLNQDTGKAIAGIGRIDIFWGGGEEAEAIAGRLKEAGDLFFLLRKGKAGRFSEHP